MFRAPLESNTNHERPSGLTFRDKVLGLFKQRQQAPSPPANNKESKPFSFRLQRGSKPVRTRSRRGLSRFIQRGQSKRKDVQKVEEVQVSLRLIEDIYDSKEDEDIDAIEEECESVSSEHTEPRDNRTNSKLNLGLSRSDISRGWNRSPNSSMEMEIMVHTSSQFRTTRTSPRSPRTMAANSRGHSGLSRQGSIRHLTDDSCLNEPIVSINSQRNTSTGTHSRRSTINRTESPSSDKVSLKPPRTSRTESPLSDKDSLKPPRTHCKPELPDDRTNDLSCPRSDPSPKDTMAPSVYPLAVCQETLMVGRPAPRKIAPEPLKPRFREFPMKYPSQPMLSVPECEALPPRLSLDTAAPEPTTYLPGFSEGDYVDDERLERILNLIQLQKTEMESRDAKPTTSCHAEYPSKPTTSQVSSYRPGFDAKDYVDDDQLEVVLQNLQQDRNLRTKQPSSFSGRGVSNSSWQYSSSYLPSPLKAVPGRPTPRDVMSPLRLTFCKHDSIPPTRREVQRTYSLPSMNAIVRV